MPKMFGHRCFIFSPILYPKMSNFSRVGGTQHRQSEGELQKLSLANYLSASSEKYAHAPQLQM